MIHLMNLPEKVKLEISKADLMEFANYLLENGKYQKDVDEDFLSIQEIENLTGLARQTIYGRVSKGTIPYYKDANGGKLRFKKSEILEWMESGKKKSEKTIQQEVENYINSPKISKCKW